MPLPSRNQQRAASEKLIRTGMVAAIRDIQDWVDGNDWPDSNAGIAVDAHELRAFLLTQLVIAGAHPDGGVI